MKFSDQSVVALRDVLAYLQADRFLDKAEAARHCGVSVRTLESWSGLPKYKPSGKCLYKLSELNAYIERFREQQTDVDVEAIVNSALETVMR